MLAVSLLSLLAFSVNPLQKEQRYQQYTPFRVRSPGLGPIQVPQHSPIGAIQAGWKTGCLQDEGWVWPQQSDLKGHVLESSLDDINY